MTTYPIYILTLGKRTKIVFPEGKKDLPHSEFWEKAVAAIVADHYGIGVKALANIPYCQRRARIVDKIVYFGEKGTDRLLAHIERAVGEQGLRFAHDDHEKRLPYDLARFKTLTGKK